MGSSFGAFTVLSWAGKVLSAKCLVTPDRVKSGHHRDFKGDSMTASHSDDPAKTAKAAASARLDGWKDIAAYLAKSERTVKRWEVDRGLPIHRVPGGAKASVYAHPSELDQWLKSSGPSESDTVERVQIAEQLPIAQPIAAEVTAPAHNPVQIRPGFAGIPQLRATVAFLGLAAVGLAFAAVAFSATGVPLPDRIHALFARMRRKPDPASSPVSDAEKSLARNYYLQGRYEWNQRTPDSLNRALDLFTQAIVHDPGYAQAYAGLADTYDLLREYSTMQDNDAFPRAIAAARKAVELDDSLAEAHRALAFAEIYGSWNFSDAEKEFRRAIELDPKDAQARRWYANAFAVSGRFEESLDQLNKAQELDPSSNATLADKGSLLANAGRTDAAIDILKEVERSAPGFVSPHFYLMRVYLDLRDYSGFLYEGQKTAETMNDPVLKDIIEAARAGYARDGGQGLLDRMYAKQKEYYLAGRLLGTTLAKTCVLMGKKQEALQLLEVAYAHRETEVLNCLADPDLLSLRDQPRFKALVAKINFPTRPSTSHPVDSSGADAPHLAAAFPHS